MFQKLETVADDPPSGGEHVRIVHPRHLIEGKPLTRTGEIPTACQLRWLQYFYQLEGPERYFPWTEERSHTPPSKSLGNRDLGL